MIYTIVQSPIQQLTPNSMNITNQIFLNIYHFPLTLVLLKYQDQFTVRYFESSLSCSFLVWPQNFSTIQWIVNFNTIPYLSKFCLRITSL